MRKAAEHPLGVGAALLCFFPLGLYLVWHHPRRTQARKLAWTGAWLGVLFLTLMPAMLASIMLPAVVASRNLPAAYPAGDPPEAGPGPSAPAKRLAGSGSGGRSSGFLPTFDDHPSPVAESLSEGAEVWLLEDCDIETGKRASGDRS